MHGLGNDYVYVNVFDERVDNAPEIARAVSDRHTGIGSDGLILIGPSDPADVRMEMYNADGSRAQMCGNGIRCVAKYAVDHGITTGPEIAVETDSGVRYTHCIIEGGHVKSVRVNMGEPVLTPSKLPATFNLDKVVDHPFSVGDVSFPITCVGMGNPHVVTFVDDLSQIDLARVGPLIENAREFPERVNAHFVEVRSANHVVVATWERASGATRACGSGACSVCVAGVLTNRTGRAVTTTLPGGDLHIEWGQDNNVYMTGPAVEVFTGEWNRKID